MKKLLTKNKVKSLKAKYIKITTKISFRFLQRIFLFFISQTK